MLPRFFYLLVLAGAAVAWSAPIARGEVFVLKSGGAVEGEFLNPQREAGQPYQVRTENGVQLSLADAVVHRVVVKSDLQKQYEARLPSVANTATGHWELAEWCKDVGLLEERKQQLQAVIAIEADHAPARKALGFQQVNGQWLTQDENMQRQGYARYKGAWRLKQEIELESRDRQDDLATKQWRKNIRMWFEQLTSGSRHAANAERELNSIQDPLAAQALAELLADSSQPAAVRNRCLDLLGKLPPGMALTTLMNLAMNDADGNLRDRCVDELKRAGSHLALGRFVAELKSKDNLRVNRAGECLLRLENPDATLPLIDALVTEHKYIVSSGGAPGQTSAGFGGQTGQGGSGQGGLGSFGFGNKSQTIKKMHENPGVLGASTILHPGNEFRYDVEAWKKWYSQKGGGAAVDLRRDR